ncbi:carboxypeptidase-like regulatory domain-containing protein [Allomuricauda sp. SCSIO 65647]|uniref:carboxypeptidase-like regulatory domain-containing protein n=1 Tax=Allomuricauda sp. SCSIO 65647 TaxID=2908843 RepID=UPI001F194B29|nr:carboxypeptidase-like regulatory domain-containing protein [Muricauda sp. SCSIO 65647]UJH68860.1 carboxypeptidase-like regulatory domain-containing protein [Muricauda sp. SCSIO 65647]
MYRLLVAIALLFSVMVSAQDSGSIAGKIMDSELKDEPLSFVNISLKDTGFKTQSNLHGNFEITEVAPGSYTMVIGFLGYDTLEFPVEIKKNGVTRIEKNLVAKSVALPPLTLSDTETASYSEPITASQKGN